MKITQTFAFEVPVEAFDDDDFGSEGCDALGETLTVSLDREQAEELLAALQEALGYERMNPFAGMGGGPLIDRGIHVDDDGTPYIPGPNAVSPDEAIARMQVGANKPDKTGRTGMPPGFRGSSSIGSGHPSG